MPRGGTLRQNLVKHILNGTEYVVVKNPESAVKVTLHGFLKEMRLSKVGGWRALTCVAVDLRKSEVSGLGYVDKVIVMAPARKDHFRRER